MDNTNTPTVLHASLNRQGQITNEGALFSLRQIVRRNTPKDCVKSENQNVEDLLSLATKWLRASHVWTARFGDGSKIHFQGEPLPVFVTSEHVRRVIERLDPVTT
jgi:hypothetical protein